MSWSQTGNFPNYCHLRQMHGLDVKEPTGSRVGITITKVMMLHWEVSET